MKLKPDINRRDRIEIKLVAYRGINYINSKTISVYDTTLEKLKQLILEAIKKETE